MADDDDDLDPRYAALDERRKHAEERLATLHADVLNALEEIDFALGIIERARASLKHTAHLTGPPKDH
jgi:hypothetical protein